MANLSDHDLLQMDEQWQGAQSEPVVRGLLGRALEDLRAARDRLNQNSSNSSRPSGSMPPWYGKTAIDDAVQVLVHETKNPPALPKTEPACEDQTTQDIEPAAPIKPAPKQPGKPGKVLGAKGFGRTQKLPHSQTEQHLPSKCAACGAALGAVLAADNPAHPLVAWQGWDNIELVSLVGGMPGWQLQVTRHLLMQQRCGCGHLTRAQAHRVDADPMWGKVALGEQRLLGPRLAGSIVYLSQRMRLSRARIQELMQELWGLELSIGLIDQTIAQAARAVEPLQDELIEQLHQASLVHVDETSWKESGLPLWLWVFIGAYTAYLVIGSRAAEMFNNVLDANFAGTLMSDGYGVYRGRKNRLRCWAHLLRKAVGLAESTHREARQHGEKFLDYLQTLKRAIFAARGTDPPLCGPVPAQSHQEVVRALQEHCHSLRQNGHEPLRAFACELLRDWDVIMRPLSEPHQPLTNNEAERALRHHVITRRISHGTRTPEGSRGYALLASIMETCRLRQASIIDLLTHSIDRARQGLPPPSLPPIPVA